MWDTEGLRQKIPELSSWLPGSNVDVIAIQEGQFPNAVSRVAGFHVLVVSHRLQGVGGPVKGGDVVITYLMVASSQS